MSETHKLEFEPPLSRQDAEGLLSLFAEKEELSIPLAKHTIITYDYKFEKKESESVLKMQRVIYGDIRDQDISSIEYNFGTTYNEDTNEQLFDSLSISTFSRPKGKSLWDTFKSHVEGYAPRKA